MSERLIEAGMIGILSTDVMQLTEEQYDGYRRRAFDAVLKIVRDDIAQARADERKRCAGILCNVRQAMDAFTPNDRAEVDQIFMDAVKEIEADGE